MSAPARRRGIIAAAIRDRLDDLGTETRDQEGNPDGGLWLDGLDAVADDLAGVALDAIADEVRRLCADLAEERREHRATLALQMAVDCCDAARTRALREAYAKAIDLINAYPVPTFCATAIETRLDDWVHDQIEASRSASR